METGLGVAAAVQAAPWDVVNRKVYADLLEETGDLDGAAMRGSAAIEDNE